MARKSGRAALLLSDENRTNLHGLAASRTTAVREVKRACVLLTYAEGLSISEIQLQLAVSRPLIYKCIDKAQSQSTATTLRRSTIAPWDASLIPGPARGRSRQGVGCHEMVGHKARQTIRVSATSKSCCATLPKRACLDRRETSKAPRQGP